MENTQSTQADAANSSLIDAPVKRLRRGDVREDGKRFWQYDPSSANGEYWMAPEQFAAEKAKEAKKRADLSAKKAALSTKLRRGDTREDGMVFWQYSLSYANGECWLTSEEFAAKRTEQAKKKADLSAKKAALTAKLCRGNPREDGKIFWQYGPDYASGEWWLTPEEFAAKQAKVNARLRDRYATDPLFSLKRRLRSRVYSALKRKGLRKNSKTEAMLGCTYLEFKAHLETQFLPGMSWENRHLWHIDHHVPCDAAGTSGEMECLFHFTNLRPLWGPDNLAKNDTLPAEHELPADLHDEVRKIWQRVKDLSCAA